jgi:hypothetical protein
MSFQIGKMNQKRSKGRALGDFEYNIDDLYNDEVQDLERVPVAPPKEPKKTNEPFEEQAASKPEVFEAPTSRVGMYWTREEDEQLVELYTKRVGPTEISEKLGRSRDSIIKRIKTLSFPHQEEEPEIPMGKRRTGKWLEREDDFAAKSYRAGVSLADVALQLGRSVENICMRLARLGVAQPQNLDDITYFKFDHGPGVLPKNQGLKWTDEAKEQVEDAFFSGESLEEIASLAERSQLSIIYQLHKSGMIFDDDLAGMVRRAQEKYSRD